MRSRGIYVALIIFIVIAIAATVFCVLYAINYKTLPWVVKPVEDYMLTQSNNSSLDPNTRNVLAEASKWVRVFETLKDNDYVYTTNGKKYDMTVFRNSNTADKDKSEETPYVVVTKFLSRGIENGQQEGATPFTSRDKETSKVKIGMSGCGAVEGKENEFKCPSASIGTSADTPDKTIEMFTTCGGY